MHFTKEQNNFDQCILPKAWAIDAISMHWGCETKDVQYCGAES